MARTRQTARKSGGRHHHAPGQVQLQTGGVQVETGRQVAQDEHNMHIPEPYTNVMPDIESQREQYVETEKERERGTEAHSHTHTHTHTPSPLLTHSPLKLSSPSLTPPRTHTLCMSLFRYLSQEDTGGGGFGFGGNLYALPATVAWDFRGASLPALCDAVTTPEFEQQQQGGSALVLSDNSPTVFLAPTIVHLPTFESQTPTTGTTQNTRVEPPDPDFESADFANLVLSRGTHETSYIFEVCCLPFLPPPFF